MKKHTRILAAIMSLIMMLTALPLVSFAGDLESTDSVQEPVAVEMRIDSTAIDSEDTAKRSENEKHFKLSDGTYIAVKYGYPVHKLNENGVWEDIDLSFSAEETDNVTSFISKTDALTAEISDGTVMHLIASDDAPPVSLSLIGFDMAPIEEADSDKTGIEPVDEAVYRENIKTIEEAVKSPALHFSDTSQSIGITYERTYSSIRQNLVINNDIENHSISFAFDAEGLTAVLDDSGSVKVKDGDEVKYIIPAPYISDSENKDFSLSNYSLEETEDGGYVLTINADSELLNSENISYPVTVTAAVTVPYKEANSLTAVSSNTPDMSYTEANIQIGKNSEGNVTRAFLNVEDFPILTENDVMLSTQLHTYHRYLNSEDNPFEIEAYPVNERWDTSSITWNYQPAYSNEPKEYRAHGGNGIFASVEWDISKEALNHYEDGEQSHGIAFTSSDETKDCTTYLPAAYAGELCPYILVNYISISQNTTDDVDNSIFDQNTNSGNDYISNSDLDQSASSYSVVLPPIVEESIYKDVTNNYELSYCVGQNWTIFNRKTDDLNQIDGVRINHKNDANTKYYFKYRSKNVSKGWLDYVYSTKSEKYDYAGWRGYAMTNLSIGAYTEYGERLDDNCVVMYRAKVADRWLNWVSNGSPYVMQTIKTEYGLSGDLDTVPTDAGWEALGNIQALEIRIYERDGDIDKDPEAIETDEFKLIDNIKMKYHELGSGKWTEFNPSVKTSAIDGIILETKDKPYYFR